MKITKEFKVNRNLFEPIPNVDSAVISLTNKPREDVNLIKFNNLLHLKKGWTISTFLEQKTLFRTLDIALTTFSFIEDWIQMEVLNFSILHVLTS